jgi:predicted ATPase
VLSSLGGGRDRTKYAGMLRFRDWVEHIRYFSMWDPKILRSTDRGKHDELGSNGEHLASLLALLKKHSPPRFDQLMERMKRMFPHIQDLGLTGGRGWGWKLIQQHEVSNGRNVALPSQHMSDGVLRILAICCLLYLENPPTIVMIEEPENGIHPRLLREAIGMLRELTLNKPPKDCQVFFTTHSPYVLDEFIFSPANVFVMDRKEHGRGAAIMKLSTDDQLARLQSGFESLGEAWFAGIIGTVQNEESVVDEDIDHR